ncbi:MAG: phytanoyl-CoA dioxygenase family protein [Alphaproteobacteria bacterium]|nr:phytanoyl-CoA dioxygenase family protein [Alphaproteobacteria bacterium]
MSAPQLDELRWVTERLLQAANAPKTALAQWVDRAEYRDMIRSAVLTFYQSKIANPFRSQFGVEPGLILNLCTIRHHPVDDVSTHVDWHMDANLVRSTEPFMTNWVTLQDVGKTAPALSFIRLDSHDTDDGPRAYWLKRLESGDSNILFSDDEIRANLGAIRIVDLEMAAGGSVSFEQFTLHRTQQLEAPTTPRTSIEFRAFHPGRMPGIVEQNATCIIPQEVGGPYQIRAFRDRNIDIIDVIGA